MRQKGQSIFEVILAVGVVAVVIVALVGLVSQSLRNTTAAKNRSEGARLVQEANEWLRAERDRDWTAFYARSNGNARWCLNTLSWGSQGGCGGAMSGKPFAREVAFVRDAANPNSVRIDARVFWSDSQGSHEIKASTHFTNWRSR